MGQFNRQLKAIQSKYASKLNFDDPVTNFAMASLTERINVCIGLYVKDVKSNLNTAFVYSNQYLALQKCNEVTFAGVGNCPSSKIFRMECDEEFIPFKSGLFDCSISFLTLNWSNDIRSTVFASHRSVQRA
jgi:hypothetical protein